MLKNIVITKADINGQKRWSVARSILLCMMRYTLLNRIGIEVNARARGTEKTPESKGTVIIGNPKDAIPLTNPPKLKTTQMINITKGSISSIIKKPIG